MTPRPGARPSADRSDPTGTRALLASLLGDTLDPGYAAAAERRRRRGRPASQRGVGPLLAVGGLLAGLLFAVAFVHADAAAPSDARTRGDLIARIRSAGAQASALASSATSLGNAVNARRDSVLGASGTLTRAEAAAGTTAVHGPGLTVTLGDAPARATTSASERPGSTPLSDVSELTDLDVRAIVNELWQDGAEAMAVNGVRLTPSSAVRFAGQAVLVDLQPITPPYRISAIGDADQLSTKFTESATAARYRTRSSAEGFGFTSRTVGRLDLPAAAGTRLRYASVPPSATPSSATPSSATPSSRPPATPSSPGPS